jgi:hypothetical protein
MESVDVASEEAASSPLGEEWSEGLSKVPTSTYTDAMRLWKIVGSALKECWCTYVSKSIFTLTLYRRARLQRKGRSMEEDQRKSRFLYSAGRSYIIYSPQEARQHA